MVPSASTTTFEVQVSAAYITLHRKAGKGPPKFPQNAIGKII